MYDTLSLWYLPPRVRELAREIDISFVLGSDVNHRKLLDLLDVVDRVDWSEVPISQARQGTRRDDRSPGSSEKARDFVWYDPYTRAVVESVTARDSSHLTRPFGGDLPKGFVLVSDDSVVRRISDSSVVFPTITVSPGTSLDVVMEPETLPVVAPSVDPAFVAVRYFLAQRGVPIYGMVSIAEAMAKVSSLVTVITVVVVLPTVPDFGVNEAEPTVPIMGPTTEMDPVEVASTTVRSVAGGRVEIEEEDWAA